MTRTDDIRIVEYEPGYAASIAEMWNASHESWGGDSAIQTEQMILNEHHNSTHLHVFLAVAGNEVVGYCSFSHYKEDAGALYIPLLNVRPDYHGRKVGKRLVLHAVEQTIRMGWPRLDLYTWPGNVKAVPAYKKAGFFWEKRDDTTHLINLIPSVMQTPAVQHYFGQLDWYADSVREIVTAPDGRRENGFDYFAYEWSKDDTHLRIEYERTGRGLRLIETDDYLIQASIPVAHRLPFGSSYPIIYEVTNKSGKPLTIEVTGKGNPAIDFELHESREIQSYETIEGKFHVQPIEEEQDPYQTHPVVEAQLLINGLSAVFKIGIEPRFPVRLKLHAPHRNMYRGEQLELELTVENEHDTEYTYSMQWPASDILAFHEQEINITVPAHSRRSIRVAARLLNYGVWHHKIHIYNDINRTTDTLVLEQYISLFFPGAMAAFGSETSEEWVVFNGQYSARLNKQNNLLKIYQGSEMKTILYFPKFGLPYSNEFHRDTASRVTFRKEDEMIMEAQYELESYQLRLTTIVKVHRNGLFSRHHVVQSLSSAGERTEALQRAENLFMKEQFNFSLENTILPYRNRYVHTAHGPDAAAVDYWEISELTENWMFAHDKHSTCGITWPASRTLMLDIWQYAVEHPLRDWSAADRIETPPLQLAVGTWEDWQDFRTFALQQGSSEKLSVQKPLEVLVNNGNPFASQALEVKILEQRNTVLDGIIQVSSHLDSIDQQQLTITGEQELQQYEAQLSLQPGPETDVINVHLDMDTYEMKTARVLFPVQPREMDLLVVPTEHGDVHTVHNGVLQLQVNGSFAPTLFSLQHHGVEWLDSSYPQLGPRSWLNPWIGGIHMQIQGLSDASLQAEERQVDFAEIRDNQGNLWSGIRITVNIQHNIRFKGLLVEQYYVTLPGVPVLATFVKVNPQTGTSLFPLSMNCFNFYKTGQELSNGRAHIRNQAGEQITYKVGKVQYDEQLDHGIVRYSSSERTQQLNWMTHPDADYCGLFLNTHFTAGFTTDQMYLYDQQQTYGRPQFHIITDVPIPDDAWNDLYNIRFGEAAGSTSSETKSRTAAEGSNR
ncbi:GNAT family N-acetyltransferase [Paenibacillus wulumuqiensis]|uniref:GNAT family N-acetyltransferase n=1 Tax=Paenibacillus wulumuqiensis TaxID=1567107 RepID=UPI0006194B3C|nr:GNAT family N-acetyltransferase [Paenibacillus wulumuqiensis]